MTRRAIAVITIGAGALFVVLGSLFPLYGMEAVARFGPGGEAQESSRRLVALTGWEYVQEPLPSGESLTYGFPVYGHGLVLAAVLAGVGALLQLRSPLLAAIGRFAVLVGCGLVVGVLWAALETLGTLFGSGNAGAAVTSDEFVGTGTWLAGGAALALLVGAVLAHDWPARVPRPAGVSVYQVDDDDTPPFGIAIPVDELDVPPADTTSPSGTARPTGTAWPAVADPPGGGAAADPSPDRPSSPDRG
ncbi:hypothetical protein [Saccharothrix stipae]